MKWLQLRLRHDKSAIGPDGTWEYNDSGHAGYEGQITIYYCNQKFKIRGRTEDHTLFGFLIGNNLNALRDGVQEWPLNIPKCWVSVGDLDSGNEHPRFVLNEIPVETTFEDYKDVEEFGVF